MPKIDGRKLSHKALEHMRLLAVRRVMEDGERPSDVMDSLGLCRTSIYPWLRRYRDKGLEALVEKIAQGPNPNSVRNNANRCGDGFWVKTRASTGLTLACGPAGLCKP